MVMNPNSSVKSVAAIPMQATTPTINRNGLMGRCSATSGLGIRCLLISKPVGEGKKNERPKPMTEEEKKKAEEAKRLKELEEEEEATEEEEPAAEEEENEDEGSRAAAGFRERE